MLSCSPPQASNSVQINFTRSTSFYRKQIHDMGTCHFQLYRRCTSMLAWEWTFSIYAIVMKIKMIIWAVTLQWVLARKTIVLIINEGHSNCPKYSSQFSEYISHPNNINPTLYVTEDAFVVIGQKRDHNYNCKFIMATQSIWYRQ